MGLRMITVDRVNDPIDIYAKDDGRFYYSLIGGEGIHDVGSQMSASISGGTSIVISDGVLSVQGRYAIIDPEDSEMLTLTVNETGYNRKDLIVAEFNSAGGDETIVLKAVQGTAVTGTASEPVLTKQDITAGGTVRQVALHRVIWSGTQITAVERYAPVIPNLNTLVRKEEDCIDLASGVDLATYMQTASDYTSYRAKAGVTINNGIPNRNTSYPVYYVKLRDFVLAYGRDTVRTVYNLYVATFHNKTLGAFHKLWDDQLISNSLAITAPGYALDAQQGKVLDDKIAALSKTVSAYDSELDKIDDCVKYDTNISGNTITTNPLAFMQQDSTHNYAWYNSDGYSGTGALPDTGKCYYYKVGNMIFGYTLATHKYYFSDDNSDVWYECVTANAASKSVTLQGVLIAQGSNSATSGTAILKITREGSTIYNELRAMADGSLKFFKNSEGSASVEQALFGADGVLTIPGRLNAAGATLSASLSGTSATFSSTLKSGAHTVTGSLSASGAISTSDGNISTSNGNVTASGDMTATGTVQGSYLQAKFTADTSNGNTFFKASAGSTDVFRLFRDTSGVIRLGTYSGSTPYYPLWLYKTGKVQATADFQVDGSATVATSLSTPLLKNSGNVQIKYTGGADVTLSKSTSDTTGYLRPSSTSYETNLGSSSYPYNAVYATNTSIQSDRKLKRDIQGIENALEFIMCLEPVQYKFKKSTTAEGRTHYGFIAQDVAKIAKDLDLNLSLARASHITKNADGTLEDRYYDGSADVPDEELSWTLDYNEMLAPLVATVQSQQNEIIELKNRIAKLEETVNMLLKQEV